MHIDQMQGRLQINGRQGVPLTLKVSLMGAMADLNTEQEDGMMPSNITVGSNGRGTCNPPDMTVWQDDSQCLNLNVNSDDDKLSNPTTSHSLTPPRTVTRKACVGEAYEPAQSVLEVM